jgi:hypothetical protein
VAGVEPTVAPVGLERVMVRDGRQVGMVNVHPVALPSTIVMGIKAVVCPGAKVTTPELGLKSDTTPTHSAMYNVTLGPLEVVKSTWAPVVDG